MEKEKAGPSAAGKKETWKEKEILDLLKDWGNIPGLFLRPMIKQLFNYRSKTGKNTSKQSQGRIVKGKALKRNTGRYRRDIIPYQGKARNTDQGKASSTSIYNTCSRIPWKRIGHNPIYNRYIQNYTMAIYKPEYHLEHVLIHSTYKYTYKAIKA